MAFTHIQCLSQTLDLQLRISGQLFGNSLGTPSEVAHGDFIRVHNLGGARKLAKSAHATSRLECASASIGGAKSACHFLPQGSCWGTKSAQRRRRTDCSSGVNGALSTDTSTSARSADEKEESNIEPPADVRRPAPPKLGTVTAQILPTAEAFFASEATDDPDKPSEGFSTVSEAVNAIKEGKMVVVVDDEDRENEGDIIFAAAHATPEIVSFMVRHTSGLICVGVEGSILDRLEVPLMVPHRDNDEVLRTAFTISVDLKAGTTTGISASDRAATIRALADPSLKPEDLRRPGHIFPLRSREGGVLKRAGHTEAASDLASMAGLPAAGALCELVNDDGTMTRLPQLKEFASKHNLHIISIADLIRYRRKREKIVERTAIARLPTKWGVFQIHSYTSTLDGIEHVAMVKGDIGDGMDVLVRVHSECLTGDIFASARCDCGPQLQQALERIEKAGRGVCVYLRGHEGRGIGLGHKLKAYNLQDEGRDTVEANVDLGLPIDSREYGVGAQILRDVGVRTMVLMTNNPAKYMGLRGYGLLVTGRVPVISPITLDNKKYLETKRQKMGHIYGSDMPGTIAGLSMSDGDADSDIVEGFRGDDASEVW